MTTTSKKNGRPIKKPSDPLLVSLDEIRDKKGITRTQLAEALNMKGEALSRIMRGVHSPTMSSLYKICKVLGVSIKVSTDPMPESSEGVQDA
jgi:transcriptional regulator with XRE-family HTH domain